MFKKILVANRGEIALRIICACKELGIRTLAVYSEADRNSLHVRFADEAICIGPAASVDSYLNIPHVISAAEIANADAIHPGYGFLAENARFAEVCQASGITFIGPDPELIRLMGEKDQARKAMAKAGLPVVPGSESVIKTLGEGLATAEGIGYPVLIKAAAGGGGRGMRIVNSAEEFADALAGAQNEAVQAFGTGDVYVEKLIERPRHIEFQMLGDRYGKVIHLGERECSIQRRHQKLLEESPSSIMDAKLRGEVGEAVVRAITGLGYCNAGTVEFLVDENRNFYFIEMNTRVQVEHPVTEMVTGIDMIKAQIQLAAGEPVDEVAAGETEIRGHAIECRINAENPETFIPCAGRISAFHTPGGTGVRVDTAAHADCVIPPYYDSLIAKLIVRGKDRKEATMRMARALEMFIVEGVETTIPLHRKILADPDFLAGSYDTHFLQRWSPNLAAARRS